MKTAAEDYEDDLAQAWDDVTGKELDPKKFAKARTEEVVYIHTLGNRVTSPGGLPYSIPRVRGPVEGAVRTGVPVYV